MIRDAYLLLGSPLDDKSLFCFSLQAITLAGRLFIDPTA